MELINLFDVRTAPQAVIDNALSTFNLHQQWNPQEATDENGTFTAIIVQGIENQPIAMISFNADIGWDHFHDEEIKYTNFHFKVYASHPSFVPNDQVIRNAIKPLIGQWIQRLALVTAASENIKFGTRIQYQFGFGIHRDFKCNILQEALHFDGMTSFGGAIRVLGYQNWHYFDKTAANATTAIPLSLAS